MRIISVTSVADETHMQRSADLVRVPNERSACAL
jgi:hypothetical protein